MRQSLERVSGGTSFGLHVESSVLQVEIALQAVHDLVADDARSSEPHDLGPLGVEELAAQALVVQRALLDRAVVRGVEARRKPIAAEAVQAA
jgi:hypothetical protein